MPNIFGIFLTSCMLTIFSNLGIAIAFATEPKLLAHHQIIDGDTFVFITPERKLTIRLYGIDCPEEDQEAGTQAHEEALRILTGQITELEAVGNDRYGRTVALVHIAEGKTMQEELLMAGVAWVAPRYCKRPECQHWRKLEETARRERRGLWQYPQPIPPWEWRKRNK